MKTVVVTSAVALVAAALGALLALRFGIEEDVPGLDRGLEGRLEALEGRLDWTAKRRDEQAAIADELAALRLDLRTLRGEYDGLAAETPADAPSASAAGPAATSIPEPAIAEIVDRRLAEIETARREKAEEIRREKEVRRIDAEVKKRMQALTEALELSPAQATLLENRWREAIAFALPLYGVLEDGQAGADDRLAAIRQLRTNRRAFDESSRGILGVPQHERFTELRQKEDQTIATWLDETEAAIRGTTPPAR